ncbi:MAG: TetR/AcrR family transcriptional regulator [Burkholderia sp.]
MNPPTPFPPPARGPADHEVRNQIIAAAMVHFQQYGYEKTTVSDLAKTIGFSKAYVYKFFESKQAIGESICSNCLREIEAEIEAAIATTEDAPEKLRRMFKAIVGASLRLFFENRKLYEIAACAENERWQVAIAYEERIRALIQRIVSEGRRSGVFERRTRLGDATTSVFLIMRTYFNPLLLQHSLDYTDEAPAQLSSLIIRSLSA